MPDLALVFPVLGRCYPALRSSLPKQVLQPRHPGTLLQVPLATDNAEVLYRVIATSGKRHDVIDLVEARVKGFSSEIAGNHGRSNPPRNAAGNARRANEKEADSHCQDESKGDCLRHRVLVVRENQHPKRVSEHADTRPLQLEAKVPLHAAPDLVGVDYTDRRNKADDEKANLVSLDCQV